jgi:hypothetical protein
MSWESERNVANSKIQKPGLLSKAKVEEIYLYPSVPGIFRMPSQRAIFSFNHGVGPKGYSGLLLLVCQSVRRTLLSDGHDVAERGE